MNVLEGHCVIALQLEGHCVISVFQLEGHCVIVVLQLQEQCISDKSKLISDYSLSLRQPGAAVMFGAKGSKIREL